MFVYCLGGSSGRDARMLTNWDVYVGLPKRYFASVVMETV